jgi:AcrR family transcriptional regulator
LDQELKSERSRRHILDAALELFSHHGYGATSVRDIAEAAKVSTGSVYHHFADKETIFRTLLDEYWVMLADPEFPFNRALATGVFPDNLEELGHAAEQMLTQYRPYVALIYVDVVEFDGSHIRKFYSDMAQRYENFINASGMRAQLERRLRPGVSPVAAVMLAARFMLNYFSVEILFGVKNHFGKENKEVIREIAGILRNGMLRDEAGKSPARAKPARIPVKRPRRRVRA